MFLPAMEALQTEPFLLQWFFCWTVDALWSRIQARYEEPDHFGRVSGHLDRLQQRPEMKPEHTG